MRNGTVNNGAYGKGAPCTTKVLSLDTEYKTKTKMIAVAEIEIKCSNNFEL